MAIDLRYQPFIIYAESKIPSTQSRLKAVSIALGVAVARFLPPSPAGTEATTHHYDTTVSFEASRIISEFNENVLVNMDLCMEVCRSFWLMRQSVISTVNLSPILAGGNGSFIERVFGMNTQASPEVIAYLNANPAVMATLVNRIVPLLQPQDNAAV